LLFKKARGALAGSDRYSSTGTSTGGAKFITTSIYNVNDRQPSPTIVLPRGCDFCCTVPMSGSKSRTLLALYAKIKQKKSKVDVQSKAIKTVATSEGSVLFSGTCSDLAQLSSYNFKISYGHFPRNFNRNIQYLLISYGTF
jgi:hypothetical protein